MSKHAASYRLVIGNKAWSSWSFRPWLVLKRFAIPFDEVQVSLRRPDTRDQILAYSPAGKVPVLHHGDLIVWDSLAIIEYLADRHPSLGIWPTSPAARAIARSVSAEMHSGFQALREHCPMDMLTSKPMLELPDSAAKNVARIVEIWKDCRRMHGADGPFLFGSFSAADAMYAPIVSRFHTYIPDLAPYGDDRTAAAYVDCIRSLPEFQEWETGARTECA